MPEEKFARVAMLWPESLKEAVREKVGARGLTSFTLDAVRERLGAEQGEVAEAASESTEGPVDEVVAEVPAAETEPVDVEPAEVPGGRPEGQHDPLGVEAAEMPQLPAVGDPGTLRNSEAKPSGADLLARIRDKAMEKGVDLTGVELKPASEVERPAPPQPSEEPAEEPLEEPAAKAIAHPNACPNCGCEMVAGECWECM